VLGFEVCSWDSEMGLITVLTIYPLGYDTIKIEERTLGEDVFVSDIMNHLAFCCFVVSRL
jgi:hypothetical protein